MFNPNDHLIDLKGKSYLQVMWRLVWFREERPMWNIDTKLEQLTDKHAVFSAKIYDEDGVQKSAGYGSESITDFRDYIEKAETKAVGRALAMLGYGTQFAPEMDEGERIVDSPVEKPLTYETALAYEVTFGQYKGKTLSEIWKEDIKYIKWLSEKGDQKIKDAISIISDEIKKNKEAQQ